MNWRWVDRRSLELLHDESLAMHGGAAGLRSSALLESALARAPKLAAYSAESGPPDLARLAAAYAAGVAKSHPFVDGNKRTSLLAMALFLGLNGYRLTASQAETTLVMVGLAAGEWDEASLAAWLRERIAART